MNSSIEHFSHLSVLNWVLQRMNEAGYPLTKEDVGPCDVLGAARDGEPLAGCLYNWFRMHPRHENANDVNVIFAVQPGARFKKADIFPAFFKHAYDHLQCGRITAIVSESNAPSAKLVRNLGFRKEGVLRRGYDGKTNAIVYGQLRHECPFYKVD
jgi:hypothetical protein